MTKKLLKILFLMFLILDFIHFTFNQICHAKSLSEQVSEILRNRIEAAGTPPNLTVGEEFIHASIILPIFYERRTYEPAWSNNKGLLSVADELVKAIQQADREGLRLIDYHLSKIKTLINEVRNHQAKQMKLNPRVLVDLDLLLTDAFLIYASHLLAGRINPQTIDAEWFANRREADLAQVLQNALENDQIIEALRSLLPPQPGYALMRKALARYRAYAAKGGWQIVPDGPKLQKGAQNERVVALRNRLLITGDLPQSVVQDPTNFDDILEQAVKKFQQYLGLEIDGAVGAKTLAALNTSVEDRIRQIEVNMERWRWLPQDLGKRHILVNIANFELDVFEHSQQVLTMLVIIGKIYRRTPVFSDKMTYLVLNPYWHVPPNLARQDILPQIKKDSTYLVKKKINVFQSWGADIQEIDPKTIDWSKITAKNLSYRFRQDPGRENALGKIKFMFPNQFNVYLHDTPSRELFKKTVRDFSSGCIRIENPIDLAEYVLRDDPKWTRKDILAALEKGVEQTVRLPEPIPIHLLYWTAWATKDGTIHFRNDIYDRDKPLAEALREEPPGL
jgi:murein L,D-transpeptidase YcbB/YkuD